VNAAALMLASTLSAARSQMAFTLGFHIIWRRSAWRCRR